MKLLALLFCAGTAFAADVTGSWKITGNVAGQDVNEACTLKQEGTKVTGTCKLGEQKAAEVTGEVTETKVTFKHAGEYEGTPLTIIYTATVQADGTLKGDLLVEPFGAAGDFTAKKSE